MTPEAQRIAIAEACGWKTINHSQGRRLINPQGETVNNHYAEPWRLPDYLNDLNAMHDAWLWLCKGDNLDAEGNRVTYGEQLEKIAEREIKKHGGSTQYITPNLTAAQRAEAFLKTIGKWKD